MDSLFFVWGFPNALQKPRQSASDTQRRFKSAEYKAAAIQAVLGLQSMDNMIFRDVKLGNLDFAGLKSLMVRCGFHGDAGIRNGFELLIQTSALFRYLLRPYHTRSDVCKLSISLTAGRTSGYADDAQQSSSSRNGKGSEVPMRGPCLINRMTSRTPEAAHKLLVPLLRAGGRSSDVSFEFDCEVDLCTVVSTRETPYAQRDMQARVISMAIEVSNRRGIPRRGVRMLLQQSIDNKCQAADGCQVNNPPGNVSHSPV
ncbi:unnamed protein product [Caenorhabditis auriculariae]|uniref:Uncharacterized protein n=1 Tax=Caenorhabditis auriculariae TaxID=2777116 RepID=A0A8S1GRS7_9PELO|nr:unnamed protein product [Caenorhabditis auriculariae]